MRIIEPLPSLYEMTTTPSRVPWKRCDFRADTEIIVDAADAIRTFAQRREKAEQLFPGHADTVVGTVRR